MVQQYDKIIVQEKRGAIMNPEHSRKIKLLKMWELLKQETDEKHPMGTQEIIARLKRDGIEVDRKILYNDIEILYANGYEVMCTRAKSNKYYVMDRSFDTAEVRVLMDAVQAAAFITERKTEVLLDKISALAGSRRGEVLKSNITKFSTVKSTNENIYYLIDSIVDAKEDGKKIRFNYFDYGLNRERIFRKYKKDETKDRYYTVNPVETVFNSDQYYLICYDDFHKNLINYRIDRMDNIIKLDSDIEHYDWLKEKDISKYKRQLFNMFSGEVKNVTFIADRSLIDVIFDKFGSGVSLKLTEDGKLKCTVEVQAGPMFIAWLCSFDNRLKVVSPPTVVARVKEHLEKTIEQYKD